MNPNSNDDQFLPADPLQPDAAFSPVPNVPQPAPPESAEDQSSHQAAIEMARAKIAAISDVYEQTTNQNLSAQNYDTPQGAETFPLPVAQPSPAANIPPQPMASDTGHPPIHSFKNPLPAPAQAPVELQPSQPAYQPVAPQPVALNPHQTQNTMPQPQAPQPPGGAPTLGAWEAASPEDIPLQQPTQTPMQASPDTPPSSHFSFFQIPGSQPQAEPVNTYRPQQLPQNQLESLKAKTLDYAKKSQTFNYKPLISAAMVGFLIFGLLNSQIILGQVQYLTTPSGGLQAPAGDVQNSQKVSAEPRIIIPKINIDVPVVYDEKNFDENKVQAALQRGVVHYGTTAVPGENGNNVIVGHSSNNWWNSGKYKFAFVLLDKMVVGDKIVLHYNSTRYVYEVTGKKIIEPSDTKVLDPTKTPVLTLITCTPPGTSWRRLVVQAKQITPDPSQNKRAINTKVNQTKALPGDSSSILRRLGDLFSR